MHLLSLGQESDLPTSLSPDSAPFTSSPKGITDEQFDTTSELDISITPEVEPHGLDDLKDISQELHDEIPKLTMLDFDDDILYA